MPEPDRSHHHAIREAAYSIWEREGRPDGRAQDHWLRAITEGHVAGSVHDDDHMDDEEKLFAGRTDANLPALLTRDVLGG